MISTHGTIIPEEPHSQLGDLLPALGRRDRAERPPLNDQRSLVRWEILAARREREETFPQLTACSDAERGLRVDEELAPDGELLGETGDCSSCANQLFAVA